jgi:hypothetical protein
MHRSTSALLLALGAVSLAACSDSNAPLAGFQCLGDTLPTTAPALINVTGQIKSNALSPTVLAGVEVLATHTGTDTLAADTSDTPGFYSLSITTGGTPVSGYLRMTKSGFLPTYAYPARPLVADAVDNVLMITSSELTFLGTAVSVTQTAGNGFIGVIVKDCDGNNLSGATVSINPPGSSSVRYNAGSTPSASATSTSADGVAYVFNVTPGNVTVQASSHGHALRAHVVNARADAVTLTEIQP